MGCRYCTSGLGENCHGPLGGDDIEASCDCDCHRCDVCGSFYCETMGGSDPCEREDEEEAEGKEMKFTLKNRPWMTSAKANTYALKTAQEALMDFENWFDGFEKELRELKDSLYLDIRREEDHQQANPEIDPTASNMAIYKTMGRRYQIEQILGDSP